MNWEIGTDIYTLLMPWIRQITNTVWLREPFSLLSCDLNEKEFQKKKEGYIADSLCCTVESNYTAKL